jgi:alginate O-acetyltransferase complex protein AlgJ
MSREEEAELALTRTEGSRGTMLLVTVLFLLTIAALPVANLAARLRREAHGHARPGADLLALLPSKAKIKQAQGWRDWVGLLPRSSEIKAAEKNLEKESIVSQYLLPRVQSVLTGTLHAGNEQVYPGRDGWLFYRPDVDYVIGPPFLDPARLKQRARDLGIQSDPVKAIVDFNQQLKARGITLVLVPVPAKPGVEARMLGGRDGEEWMLANPSFADFRKDLAGRGVTVLDLRTIMAEANAFGVGQLPPMYLKTDTHWLPRMMAGVASELAKSLSGLAPAAAPGIYRKTEIEVAGMGDTAALLKLPRAQTLYPRQKVTIQQIQTDKGLWRPSPESELLLLGDSFSNIFSLAAMGWGESAGLAEQLSYQLNRPLDCILQNSDGAFATREALSRDLARGHDRLAGKKVVIWEFAERELMFGNWKLLSMALGEPKPAKFYNEPPPAGVVVTATVAAISFLPRPGTVPYKDHIFSVHLEEIEGSGEAGNVQAIAYLWSMRENVSTPAARWRLGDRVKLRLTPWPGAHPEREKFNHSDFDEPELQLALPVWADVE